MLEENFKLQGFDDGFVVIESFQNPVVLVQFYPE